jgi:glycerophosphoryl diester phosphodiesterase
VGLLTDSPPRPFAHLARPLLFGHRGASLHAPENTLAAFEQALFSGADVLELDVHLTRDAEVVVVHDDTVERTTEGRGAVREYRYSELVRFDAGYRYTASDGQYLFRGRGLVMPRLGDVLAAFPAAAFNIELKHPGLKLRDAVLEVISGLPARQVLLTAANDETMISLQQAQPACALGLSVGQIRQVVRSAFWGGSLQALEHVGGRALQIPPRHRRFLAGPWPLANRRVIAAAHAA